MPESSKIAELLEKGLVKKGSDPALKLNRISSGLPSLDELLGGGIPKGRFVGLYGPESTGKTLMAQYITSQVQKSERPLVVLFDLETSFDEAWWQQTGVDTESLIVSTPPNAEAAIDIMRTLLTHEKKLGMIVIDSLGAMAPKYEVDEARSSEDKPMPGAQAKVITMMYRQCSGLLNNQTIFLTLNQMRDSIGTHDELAGLPGGRAHRHYSHIILRTKRTEWIKESGNNVGFEMEITSRKNKTCAVADGTSITLPFRATSQIDLFAYTLEAGITKGLIGKSGPYYRYGDTNMLGMTRLRTFFQENPNELQLLEAQLRLE